MEYDALGFDFSILDINFVTTKNNWYVFADTDQIPMPIGYIFVCYPGCNVKHDNGTLSLNIIAVAKATKFFLASCIPDIEADRSTIGMKDQWMDLDS